MNKKQDTACEKEKLFPLIREKYPLLVKQYEDELCPTCTVWKYGKCDMQIIPVTTKGEKCPYYEKNKERKTTETAEEKNGNKEIRN